MVQGTVSLIQGLSKVMMYDPVAKEQLFDIIRESASLVSGDNAVKLEKLVCNLEDHFTAAERYMQATNIIIPSMMWVLTTASMLMQSWAIPCAKCGPRC